MTQPAAPPDVPAPPALPAGFVGRAEPLAWLQAAAGEAPRVEHVGSATPTGKPGAANGGTIQVEPGIPEEVVKELIRRGHEVKRVAVNGGGFQGIVIDPKTGMLHGGSESRKDGAAVGY